MSLIVIMALLLGLGGVLVGALGVWLRYKLVGRGFRAQADSVLREAESERQGLLRAAEIDAKEIQLAAQREHEAEAKRRRDEVGAVEKRLRQRESNVDRKNEMLEKRESELRQRQSDLDEQARQTHKAHADAENKVAQAERELERVAGLSTEEARQRLLQAVEDQVRKEAGAKIQRIEAEAALEAKDRANKIIAGAIQRLAGPFVSEKTVSVVELPSDDMKGRIIGREGRNIRAIESVTGVDVIIDDTPEVVVLSAFDPVRREVAKLALERLIADGRIHPARIEEVVNEATQEIDELVLRHGEQAAFDLGIPGMRTDLLALLGRLKYRTVNGQNLWNHAVETAYIAGMMAAELGANVQLAKRAGLLHDVGKAVDHEVEGDHANIGAEQCRRMGEKAEVVAAIRHHHDESPPSVLSTLVQAADTLSKARPGARREVLESYVKRLEDMERISMSFKGVGRAYAIQSGREIRVLVNYEDVTDQEALILSGDIAQRIQDELTYPGEVRVTVIREARATEIAR